MVNSKRKRHTRKNPHRSVESPAPRRKSWLVSGAIVLALLFVLAWYSVRRVDRPAADIPGTEVIQKEIDSHDFEQPANASPETSSGELATLFTRQIKTQLAEQSQRVDPRHDGWQTEAFAESALAQLKKIAEILKHADSIDIEGLAKMVSAEFACQPLRPAQLAEVFRGPALVIRRSGRPASDNAPRGHRGAKGLADALQSLAKAFEHSSDMHVHFKLFQVEPSADSVTTAVYYEASGAVETRVIQQRATWHCRWTSQSNDDPPRLLEIVTRDFEEAATEGEQGALFADCTEAVLGDNRSFRQQLGYGLNHWLGRIERVHRMNIFSRYGIAVADVNGDDLDDVYVCQPGGLPNRLYIQNPSGTATDRSKRAGVDWLDHTSNALFVDLDNDGDQDLVAATIPALLVMENDSTGRFQQRAILRPADHDLYSLSAADYDSDGDLDLYVSIDFSSREDQSSVPFVYHDANDGGANRLFRNDLSSSQGTTSWQFTDVTKECGLDINNRRHSLAAGWEDYDNDGDQDLYVANDYGQNCLYRNDAGRFIDVARDVGVVDAGSGMSVSWADYNRDGLMDLYVGNMFSSAGNRITRQPGFKPEADEALRNVYTRFAKGNSLFENMGDGRFAEVGAQADVEMARWAWSSLFVDINNDGWEDLLVANGHITTEDTGDL